MKQILQDLNKGTTQIADIPVPQCARGSLLIKTRCSLVSAGTERMLVDFGKGNLLQKALQQPDKVRQVLEKIHTDGVFATLNTVRNKLDAPLPLGYCNVGRVLEAGKDAGGFAIGDRVVSNGRHAEYVTVARNLCAKIPAGVDDESAAFTVIGAIALQGIRLIAPTLGETVVVTGLGLVGLVAVQLLRAHGCRVLGIDFDAHKTALARQFGAETVDLTAGEDPLQAALEYSRGRGVDAVLITASTKSNLPIHQAATMCRKRGRIVLVGVVGMEMSRADFYEKELSFQVSCSYGPGRYDNHYEEKGNDYPIGFVRWTEQRNFEAVLDMLADGRLDFKPLISHRFAVDDAAQAYQLLSDGNPLGILLQYPHAGDTIPQRQIAVSAPTRTVVKSAANISFIGAGNYAGGILIPAFAKTGAQLRAVASASGVSAVHAAKKYGFHRAATDAHALLQDDGINAVVIATRHDSHAFWVCEALAAGKHVFVEKPLALNRDELTRIEQLQREHPAQQLMVGFNRRYAPQVAQLKKALLAKKGPKSFVMTINAGAIAASHWTQDADIGGGRIIGEACHFIDLLRFLAGTPINEVRALNMAGIRKDTVTITLGFADGSLGTIHYFANGSKAFPKERLEIFADGGIAQLDNFRSLRGFGWPELKKSRLWRQDKGQQQCAQAFVDAIASGSAAQLISFDELKEVTQACFDVAAQI